MVPTTKSPIPPPGEREDYICKLSTTKHDLWILLNEKLAAYESVITAGLTPEKAMENLGGVFYTCCGGEIGKPPSELIEKAEVAYSLLAEGKERYCEAPRSGGIGMRVFLFIGNINPWFRPRELVPGMEGRRGVDGKIVTIVCETEEELMRSVIGN